METNKIDLPEIKHLVERIKLLDKPNFDPVPWTEGTNTLLRRIFPKSGDRKADYLDEIGYYVLAPSAGKEIQDRRMLEGKEQARQFLNEFINEIKNFGIETMKEQNKEQNDHPFFSMLKNGYFWTTIAVIAGGSFTLGLYFGNNKFDKDKNELYEQNLRYKSIIDSTSVEIQNRNKVIHDLTDSVELFKKNLTK